jgi:predicted RNA-binding Zn-ribbon protein involved in translation (DUF1610 family)
MHRRTRPVRRRKNTWGQDKDVISGHGSADVGVLEDPWKARSCSLWVKSRHCVLKHRCPICAKSGLVRCNKKIHLFDNIVGAREEHRRRFDADGFRRLRVDDEFKVGRVVGGRQPPIRRQWKASGICKQRVRVGFTESGAAPSACHSSR